MKVQDGGVTSFALSVLSLLICLRLFGMPNDFCVAAALNFHAVFIAQANEFISF